MPESTRAFMEIPIVAMSEIVTIEKLVYGGEGLARNEGRVVLIPFVLPGERAEVERTNNLHARLMRLETTSEVRVAPGCPYYRVCGGCDYQHAPYDYQLQQKVAILREVMQRIGKFAAPYDTELISGPEWQYRNRVQLHYAHERIGYLEAGSHRLCPISQCPISSPKINEVIAELDRMARERRFPRHLRSVEVFTNENDVQLSGFEERPLELSAAGYTFRVSPRSFFQVNRFLIDALVTAAIGDVSASTALDLYAGVGLFSLPLSGRCKHVVAVEGGKSAAADLRANAERAGAHIEIHYAAVDDYVASLDATPELLLADPPRAGLGKLVTQHIVRLKPPRLHIVACDPTTLARDLSTLLSSGYRVNRMILVDLFPQTYHLETVVHLSAS
jgi:23S rRNA (uracil1939-C5)-methyltransferase